MTSGWIYVLSSNLSFEGKPLLKIGFTTRSVERRMKELQTGSVGSLSIEYIIQADDARQGEQLVHQRLAPFRVRIGGGKEFFSLEAEEAIRIIKGIALEVSSDAVNEEREARLNSYRSEIGAERISRIGSAVSLVTGVIFFVILYNIFQSGWVILAALFLFPVVCLIPLTLFERYIVEPRYGARIRSMRERIERDLPLPTKEPVGLSSRRKRYG